MRKVKKAKEIDFEKFEVIKEGLNKIRGGTEESKTMVGDHDAELRD